jgi:outer membrane protein
MLWTRAVQGSDVTRALPASSWQDPAGAGLKTRPLPGADAASLSLTDAVAYAIANNLDVEVARYAIRIAKTDVDRARGGGVVRSAGNHVSETPVGVGGPVAPLLNQINTVGNTSPSLANAFAPLDLLESRQTNAALTAASDSAALPVPQFDGAITGRTTWLRRYNSALNPVTSPLDFVLSDVSLIQGFSNGSQLQLNVNNAAQAAYATRGSANPFTSPNVALTFSQPLVRGFGRDVNLRYLRIARLNEKISALNLTEQVTSTVYGVARLYYDLVSLTDDLAVKGQILQSTRELYNAEASQVRQGTMPEIELTRMEALLSSAELETIQAEGRVRQQETILRSELWKSGKPGIAPAAASIAPADPISIPVSDEVPEVDELVKHALLRRSDVAGASLQVESSHILSAAAANAKRIGIDVVGSYQTRGSIVSPLGAVAFDLGKVVQGGIQFDLPLRNRLAQADAARAILEVRQADAQAQRFALRVRAEVESSIIALRTARAGVNAASRSRRYQEALLDAERVKLTAGASTNLTVLEREAALAQARSTEIVARNTWVKARLTLDRASGDLLERNGILGLSPINYELAASGVSAPVPGE